MAKSNVISGADLRNVDDTGIESHVILVSTDISFYALSYSRSLTWRKIADINYGIMTPPTAPWTRGSADSGGEEGHEIRRVNTRKLMEKLWGAV